MFIEVHLTADQREAVETFSEKHRTALLTLLFTDIEHSTSLRSELGDVPASRLIDRHNEVIREVLGGFPDAREISTAGDSFFLVFAKPSDAVRFALLAQLRLREFAAAEHPGFHVNIGIELGEVVIEEEADGGDLYDVLGMQVSLAARITDMAAGGQILLTRGVFDNARQILKGKLLPGIGELEWLNHGAYLIKGFEEPFTVCEVGEKGIAPLARPADCESGKHALVPGAEPVLGWRPAVEQTIPGTEWVVEEKLGEGGFGELWRARHRRTKFTRAFKFCFRADRLRSLKREMTLFRILRETLGEREDIARLYDVQLEEAPYYLEIEDTPGGDLGRWIESRGGFEGRGPGAVGRGVPLEMRLEFVAQIATALAAAHSVGVIHRDVKPSNILVEENKDGAVQIRVTDFGIGSLADPSLLERAPVTVTGFTEPISARSEISSRTGTRMYMAPELIAGRSPSIQSDVYSLGVLLYQMIIGDLTQPMTTDWARRIGDPLLREDLGRCLAGEPEERFAGAADLAQRLRSLPQRRADLAEREAADRAAARRKRFSRTATVTLAVIAVFVGAWSWIQIDRRRQAELALDSEKKLRKRAEDAESVAKKETDRAERELYYSSLALAEKYIEDLRYDAAREQLDLCPSRFRHWEWGWLRHLCNLDLLSLDGHTERITDVAFSPNGDRVATVSGDETLRVWDLKTGREALVIEGRNFSPTRVAFTADGKRIVTAGLIVRMWDAETGREIPRFGAYTLGVRCFALSHDGKWLALGRKDVSIWNVKTGRPVGMLGEHKLGAICIAFSPDGNRVATGGYDQVLRLWNVSTGKELWHRQAHDATVLSVAFSPDGKRIATAGFDGTAKIWDVETGEEVLTYKNHLAAVSRVAFSPDGKRVASSSDDKTASVWDAETGEELLILRGHSDAVNGIAFSPDGRFLVTAGQDKVARIWDAHSPQEVAVLGTLVWFAFHSRNEIVTAAIEGEISSWDLETGRKTPRVGNSESSGPTLVGLSPSGDRYAVMLDDHIEIRELQTGHTLGTIGPGQTFLAFSGDGKRAAVRDKEGAGTVWEVSSGRRLLRLGDSMNEATLIALSFDGRYLAASHDEESIEIWNVDDGTKLREYRIHGVAAHKVAFSLDGQWLVAGNPEGTVKVWNTRTGEERLSLGGRGQPNIAVAISHDGKRIATASKDRSITIRDMETDRELLTLEGHLHRPIQMVFGPDGERLASVTLFGKTILIWNALPWREENLPGEAGVDYSQRVRILKLQRWKRRFTTGSNGLFSVAAKSETDPEDWKEMISVVQRIQGASLGPRARDVELPLDPLESFWYSSKFQQRFQDHVTSAIRPRVREAIRKNLLQIQPEGQILPIPIPDETIEPNPIRENSRTRPAGGGASESLMFYVGLTGKRRGGETVKMSLLRISVAPGPGVGGNPVKSVENLLTVRFFACFGKIVPAGINGTFIDFLSRFVEQSGTVGRQDRNLHGQSHGRFRAIRG